MILKLCSIRQLPAEGALKGFRGPHADLCVGVVNGMPLVIDDRCSHAGARLSEGSIQAGCVRCPLHAVEFDLSDGSPTQEWLPPVASYETRIYGDEVFVRIPAKPRDKGRWQTCSHQGA
jgi:nitrite reductase (NADH) small subunit